MTVYVEIEHGTTRLKNHISRQICVVNYGKIKSFTCHIIYYTENMNLG